MDWKITQIECYAEHEGLKDVVMVVHWRVFNGEVNNIPISVFGAQHIPFDATKPFTDFSELTEAQVLDWLWDAMGADKKAEIEAAAEQAKQDILTPAVVKPPLPWA